MESAKIRLEDAITVLNELHANGELTYNAYSQLHDLVSLAVGDIENSEHL